MDARLVFSIAIFFCLYFPGNAGKDEEKAGARQIYSKPHIRRFQFHVLLRSQKEECFYQDATVGTNLVVFYQIMNDGGKIRFRHLIPGDVEDHVEVVSRGHRSTEIKEEGIYTYCFTNFRRNELQLHIMLSVIDRNLQRRLYEESAEVPEEYQGTWNATIELLNDVDTMYKFMFQKRRRTYYDLQLVEGNGKFVVYWSVAQCFVIILAGVLEVFVLRTMFRTVSVTPTNKPRS
ncbi:putative cargo transport protein EMP24 [Apostichopus japonicus]|uniref:Putative cargo transport protein EMP24 n=2 Tax=Stichopus japonicus TaxID=307972 RepID=A0A2G8LDL4_STIJA|nr:putative cargo transport protein EMP24 [Apostichopus japonicus]